MTNRDIALETPDKQTWERVARMDSVKRICLATAFSSFFLGLTLLALMPEWVRFVQEGPVWARIICGLAGGVLILLAIMMVLAFLGKRATEISLPRGVGLGFTPGLLLGLVLLASVSREAGGLVDWWTAILENHAGLQQRLLMAIQLLADIFVVQVAAVIFLGWWVDVAYKAKSVARISNEDEPDVWSALLRFYQQPKLRHESPGEDTAANTLSWRLVFNRKGRIARSTRYVLAAVMKGKDPILWLRVKPRHSRGAA